MKPDPVEEVTKSGIILNVNKLDALATVTGIVVEVGPDCWPENKFIEPAAKVGDRVLYQRGSGMRVPDGKGDFIKDILILNDLDIVAVIENDPEGDK